MGLGLGEVLEEGAAEGRQLEGLERQPERRVGAGTSLEVGSPCDPCKAGMWGHQARTSS